MGNCLWKRSAGDDSKEQSPPVDGNYAKILLQAQNKYRSQHGVVDMTLNQDMCKDAQKYAETLAKKNLLKHSETADGENLAMGSGSLSAQDTADMWYNEIADYNFSSPGFASNTGHFTQVVWKNSKEFGCGVATGSSGTYVVGRYRPAGNINTLQHFKDNVFSKK